MLLCVSKGCVTCALGEVCEVWVDDSIDKILRMDSDDFPPGPGPGPDAGPSPEPCAVRSRPSPNPSSVASFGLYVVDG